MTVYSYVIEHDLGFAPNPFHGACTLACCKPDIRKAAKLGDIVIGTGATATGLVNNMVYWMRVDEIIDFDQYRTARRFRSKRPDMRAPGKAERFGDNIYERDPTTGLFKQDFSFHSNADGSRNEKNLKRDTGKTERILIGRDFAYFGVKAPEIPEELRDLIKKGPGHKCRFSAARAEAFETWATGHPERGYVAKPTHWASLK
ncbi:MULTISPECIES: hypothetical protein [unclassified Sphingomonas]|uniref:Nmad2 family putative nucleotide modification protein n=1 Tax=unclassified Sphingomonas TaxID=196159 RepID=UPI002151036E|nr:MULTISPECIES: hypothetical protein [unclassified Sphingomonas]MCR5870356.1 hypothetical protein [Sphingomonas sp. J344]UUY01309.1 hypothetical protein LRS08_09920 [Sphingomonas sp. J315]